MCVSTKHDVAGFLAPGSGNGRRKGTPGPHMPEWRMPAPAQVALAAAGSAAQPVAANALLRQRTGTLCMKTIAAVLSSLLPITVGGVAPHACASPDVPAPAVTGADLSGLGDFDFIIGDWRVHHRVMDRKTSTWSEFEGTGGTRKIRDGGGNLEDNVRQRPGGPYRAAAGRTYDRASGPWAIWWVDGRYPHGRLAPPVKGRFEDGAGRFYS